MNHRVDFSRNAKVYDQRHGSVIPGDVLQALAGVAEFQRGAAILDLGAGTGRVAVALAMAGCEVVGLEPSWAMLTALRLKAAGLPVRGVAGEGAHLPFPASYFDGVVLARVLYLMPDWRDVLSEAIRVLKPGGPLLHEWGNGGVDEEWVQIREHARRLFQHAGVAEPFHPGARSEAENRRVLEHSGFASSRRVTGSRARRDHRWRVSPAQCRWRVLVHVERSD